MAEMKRIPYRPALRDRPQNAQPGEKKKKGKKAQEGSLRYHEPPSLVGQTEQ